MKMEYEPIALNFKIKGSKEVMHFKSQELNVRVEDSIAFIEIT